MSEIRQRWNMQRHLFRWPEVNGDTLLAAYGYYGA